MFERLEELLVNAFSVSDDVDVLTKCQCSDRRYLRRPDEGLVSNDGYLERQSDANAGQGLVSNPMRRGRADVERVQ